jgi:hypothetical protein
MEFSSSEGSSFFSREHWPRSDALPKDLPKNAARRIVRETLDNGDVVEVLQPLLIEQNRLHLWGSDVLNLLDMMKQRRERRLKELYANDAVEMLKSWRMPLVLKVVEPGEDGDGDVKVESGWPEDHAAADMSEPKST